MGSGFSKKKKQAKAMQQQLMQMQKEVEKVEVTGSAGNGLVTVTLSGEYQIKKIKINPECVDEEDIEGLEDLVKAAFQDAHAKIQEQTGQMGGGMPQGMPDLSSLGMF